MLNRILTFFAVAAMHLQVHAMSMQEVFDKVNAQGNVSAPGVLQGQTMNMYTGGSLFMRMPKKTYNLATVTPPSWNAGCGGIDLFMGGFSFINKEQFVAMMRNIGSNALGYGFKLAISNLCPTCDNVMQALQSTAQQINRMNIDSCETAKGVINASAPDSWTRGRQEAAKGFGVDSNIFSDISDSWTNVMNNASKANDTINKVASTNPAAKDAMPTGNVTWKALKKLNGIDDQYRMIVMSIVGTAIFDTKNGAPAPNFLPPLGIEVDQLVGSRDTSADLDFPIYSCDTMDADGCLNPTIASVSTGGSVKSFRAMVRTKMYAISDKIASRQPHDDVNEVINFISVTDVPVYKMIAIGTSLNNTGLSDTLINRYQDLIAAKYAEVYLKNAVADLVSALNKYKSVAGSGSVSDEINKLLIQADKIKEQARSQMASAYTQTMSTYNMMQEIQFMERSLNASLSQSMRASLTFGRSLK